LDYFPHWLLLSDVRVVWLLIFNLSHEEPFPYPISTNVSTPSE